MAQTSRTRYDAVAIALHWVIGGAIALVWLLETARGDLFAKGSWAREALKSFHEPAGTVVLALVLLRLVWRALHAPPSLPEDMKPAERLASNWAHRLLYVGMLAVPVVGIAAAFARGHALDLGILQIASPFPGGLDRSSRHLVKEAHELVANFLLLLAFVHAGAGLWHHYFRHDDVLSRMLPWRPSSGP